MVLKQEASHIKEVKEVQRQFIAKTGCKDWVKVTERLVNLQKDNDIDDNQQWYALLHLLKRVGEGEIEGVFDIFCAHYIRIFNYFSSNNALKSYINRHFIDPYKSYKENVL